MELVLKPQPIEDLAHANAPYADASLQGQKSLNCDTSCFFRATSCSGVIRAEYRSYGPMGPVIPAAPAGAKSNATSWCRCHFDALGPAKVVLYSRNQLVADSMDVENVRLGPKTCRWTLPL